MGYAVKLQRKGGIALIAYKYIYATKNSNIKGTYTVTNPGSYLVFIQADGKTLTSTGNIKHYPNTTNGDSIYYIMCNVNDTISYNLTYIPVSGASKCSCIAIIYIGNAYHNISFIRGSYTYNNNTASVSALTGYSSYILLTVISCNAYDLSFTLTNNNQSHLNAAKSYVSAGRIGCNISICKAPTTAISAVTNGNHYASNFCSAYEIT
jgi:hypothetical protein